MTPLVFHSVARAAIALICALSAILSFSVSAQESTQETVSVSNNWDVGDCGYYRSYSGRIRIEGGDTITEREGHETITKILFAAELPDDDKVFVVTTHYADSAKMIKSISQQKFFTVTPDGVGEEEDSSSTAKDKEELYAQFLKLKEIPVTIITDFSGEVKDIYDYESLRAEMDSCFMIVKAQITDTGIPDHLKLSLMMNMQKLWDQAASKEALMERCDLFRYYGYNYQLGTRIDHTRLPLLTGDHEVDATVTFSCDILKDEDGNEYIEIVSVTSYDSDQVMDYVFSNFLSEDDKREYMLKEPDRPYVSMNVTETFLFEPKTGTVLEYSREKRTVTPEKSVIDYAVCELE